jgi:hypothetical protein
MDLHQLAEQALNKHFDLAVGATAPPRLVAAMRHAGGRVPVSIAGVSAARRRTALSDPGTLRALGAGGFADCALAWHVQTKHYLSLAQRLKNELALPPQSNFRVFAVLTCAPHPTRYEIAVGTFFRTGMLQLHRRPWRRAIRYRDQHGAGRHHRLDLRRAIGGTPAARSGHAPCAAPLCGASRRA